MKIPQKPTHRSPSTTALILWLTTIAVTELPAAPFIPARNAHCVAFSPDGRLLATGTSGLSDSQFPPRPHPSPRKCGVIEMWEVNSGNRLWRTETFGDLTRVGFSPDGKTVASSRLFTTADGVALHAVHVYDAATGASVAEFDRCHSFDYSPEGQQLAVLSRTRCVLFAANDRQRLHEIAPLAATLCVRFAPASQHLAGICRTEEGKYVVRICEVKTGRLISESVGFSKPFYNISYSPDGDLMSSGHTDGTVLMWDVARMAVVAKLQTGGQGIQHAFFSPDGNLIAVGDQNLGDVVIFEIATGKELRRWTFKEGAIHTFLRRNADERERPEQDPQRFGFSADGKTFVAGCHGALIRTVDTGQLVRQFGD